MLYLLFTVCFRVLDQSIFQDSTSNQTLDVLSLEVNASMVDLWKPLSKSGQDKR